MLLEVVAEVEAEAEEEEVEDLEAPPDDPIMMIFFCRCQSSRPNPRAAGH